MNLRQLTYFLAAADTGSFTDAAQRCYVAQPSLSHQIKALEAELGGELFERTPRGVRLSPAGRAFLPDARTSVVSAERAAAAARRALRHEIGELHIATVRSLSVALLPDAIRRWRELYPGIGVRLHEFSHARLVEQAVLEGVGEVGVGPLPLLWHGLIEQVGWDELVVVLPSSDPLANSRGPVSLSALADRDWVLFESQYGLASLVAAACARAGFRPRGVVETAQVDAAARLAASGLGPALIPANVAPRELDALVRSLDPPAIWNVAAYTLHEWSPPASDFIELLRVGRLMQRRPRRAWVLQQDWAMPNGERSPALRGA